MTKEEVRVVTISKLDLSDSDIVLDIGAGTGSLSIEAARICKTYALERKEAALDLIKKNKDKFGVSHLQVIDAYAPEGLPDDAVTKVIIGGSGGKMYDIFESIEKYPIKKVVVNTITLENTTKALEAMKSKNYKNIEVVTVNISKSRSVGGVTMMMGQNPINIITGEKNEN
ncbi:precorrin-6Y C5,15-methyltransferase (decarboxylating) subunit CbiT [Acidaminobacter sp. JC074]|nr:precorrin-6Y C5,15-methyltransferase (decarboxylating) subunit CbiT [Acidaminobacter sp. JC074]